MLIRTGDDFRRWQIVGPEVVLVDLAIDSPATSTPTVTFAGPTFAPEELAVRKTLALYGRAAPRDFIDVYVLHQRFDREATLRHAADADRGFDLELFAQMLRSHARVDDVDFPDVGVAIADLRAYFDAWAEDISRRQRP